MTKIYVGPTSIVAAEAKKKDNLPGFQIRHPNGETYWMFKDNFEKNHREVTAQEINLMGDVFRKAREA